MKKQLFLLLGLISAVFSVQAQRTFVDASPSGRQYVRPVEGGGMVVSIDSITPLPEMLARLNGKWEFIETGKAYWIGYTDDMFSIAARRESAIQPLLKFIRNSANPQGKYGAVYCLHLIGINCRIVGRFKEEFANKKAREALLSLLIYPEIAPVIIRLLMRDPWQSDVPIYFELLAKPSENSWELVNAVKLQNIPELPIQQEQNIPKKIGEAAFPYPRVNNRTRLKEKKAINEGRLSSADKQILGILKSIKDMKRQDIEVEDALFYANKFWGRWNTEFGCKNCIGVGGKLLTVATFLENMDDTRIHYYFNGNGVIICTSETARQLLTEWWNAQADSFKGKYHVDKADANSSKNLRIGY